VVDPFSLAALALVIPGVAIAARGLFERLIRTKTRELNIQLPEGATQQIRVGFGADARLIANAVNQAFGYEQGVIEYLRSYAAQHQGVQVSPSPTVDRVIRGNSRQLGIEIKIDPGTIIPARLRADLASKEGLDKLLVISPRAPPAEIIAEVHRQIDPKKVSFVKVEDPTQPEELLQILEREFAQ
jgi:hypothetical protein